MKYVFFILLRATPAWLRLSREQRRAMNAEHLVPLLAGGEAIRMRYFDAEAFSADCSDVMMVETDDPKRHYFFMEHLRDSGQPPYLAHSSANSRGCFEHQSCGVHQHSYPLG